MKKKNRGFMLAETLLVTTFVAGVLIYLYIQFSNLESNYSESYSYNPVNDLYSLQDVVILLHSDSNAMKYIRKNLADEKYIDISNCSIFTDYDKCHKLFNAINVDEIFITSNIVPKQVIQDYSKNFTKFINKINTNGSEVYRVVASFNNNTYATIRFGDINE